MLLVTSLGLTQYQQYGQRMLNGLKENSKLPVRVYTEDELTIPHKRLHEVKGWESFQEDTKHIEPQSYLFDARRFSHKVYAQLDAFEDSRYVVWLDADIVIKKEITKSFLKRLLKETMCAYLGRNGCYTETGFLIFDTKHPDFDTFKNRYAKYYDERLLFTLPYWIDCLAFDHARHGLECRNLTPDVSGMVDVFSRSPLKDHMQHDKGNLKYRRDE